MVTRPEGYRSRAGSGVLRGRANEVRVLSDLVEAVRGGESRTLVLTGEPGVGKTALLDYVATHAAGCSVVRAVGVQSEMELAFAGLHQLCGPMLDRLGRLPAPQRAALETAFSLREGPAPDRFVVGLAVLSLMSEVAGEKPILCLVDDRHWLDSASTQTLDFVARRLRADPVGLLFTTRDPVDDQTTFRELRIEGLPTEDAQALLESVLPGPIDPRVQAQLVAETRGNPLALVELPRGLTPAELAGGFGLPAAQRLAGHIEESFRRQLETLPESSRQFVQLAAADSSGDPLLMWRAAELLGIPPHASQAAVECGLIDVGAQVRFRHPLVRSAVYQAASLEERQVLHRALAGAADPEVEPDRRAWHLAQAAPAPDEAVARELEQSAQRAQRRGGMAAAAAFRERAALLTPDPRQRTGRLLAAARAKSDAGALDAALGLLLAVEARPTDVRQAAEVELLRGQIALDQRRGGDAAKLLLNAARTLAAVDTDAARDAHLDALVAAVWASDMASPRVLEVAGAARNLPPSTSRRVPDVLLDAVAVRMTEGFSVAAPHLRGALTLVRTAIAAAGDTDRWLWLAGGRVGQIIAMELWDDGSWQELSEQQVQFARNSGVLMHLAFALNYSARQHILAGNLATAERLVEEDQLLAEAAGNQPIADTAMMLAAWRGRPALTADLATTTTAHAHTSGADRLLALTDYARAVLYNGVGDSESAYAAASRAFAHEPMGYGSHIVPELIESAARTGNREMGRTALGWLIERSQDSPSHWAAGIEELACALANEGAAAEESYRHAIDHLSQCRIRTHLARAHLLYGEWLRREQRRTDAREHLRVAHDMLDSMGASAFAERARRELVATGESVRSRPAPAQAQALTAQEAQVARLARDGMSNPEIGARLFISPRTVQYHLGKVFTKLDISSRNQLHQVLPDDAA